MKKLITLFVLSVFALGLNAQVARNYVVVEIATGTWCYYCPGAAMGADDLHANGDPVAIIENHNGDEYATDDSDARNSYYNVGGFPTANFDGKYDEYVGGSNTESNYDDYLPIVESRIIMQSSHAVEIYGTHSSDEYTITVRYQKQAGYEGDDMWLRLALTESDIPDEWQGMDEVNFVNRLMAPDADGTDLSEANDFAVYDVELEFTFNNSWDDTECELVTFIQDDDNKEIIQCNKVMLNDLLIPPPKPNAAFTSDVTDICESGTVVYTPATETSQLTYNWTFEGGTPGTSSEISPSVYYDQLGSYNVSLIVSDAIFSDTTAVSDFIMVVTSVDQPDQPSGDDVICSGNTYSYEIPLNENAFEYLWEINPTDAGILTWDMNEAILEPAGDWTGDFTIKVRGSNVCGDSDWSDELNVSLYTSPIDYTLEGGGSYCDGGDGLELTLADSDVGVDYELYLGAESTGIIVEGTGSGISFGLQTDEGYYSVAGYTEHCESPMEGQVQIYITYPPLAPGTPEGNTAVCNNVVSEYTTTGNVEADSYNWFLSPEDAGIIEGDGLSALITWDPLFSGDALVSVQGVNFCGDGEVSEDFEVAVPALPTPEVNGEALVCNDHFEDYLVEEAEGGSYTWTIEGGTITDGQGTFMITVEWGEPGPGLITVVEETENGCIGDSPDFVVTIDDCTGIGETDLKRAISIHPNPATDFVNITSDHQIVSVAVFSLSGELVINTAIDAVDYKLNTSQYRAGLYLIKITTEKGVISKRLIIE
jgi:PKD repeat protein